MKKQPWMNFMIAGVSITEFGLKIPSPVVSLELNNSEITSFTSWTLTITVGGDDSRGANMSAFEALLYSAAQSSYQYNNSSGIPVSFMFGWLDSNGSVAEYSSYQGFTLTFKVSTTGMFMRYQVTGFASIALQSSMPVLNIPALTGIVQPSAVVEGLAKAVKADSYYDLDIDHDDAPTLVNHGAMTTSFKSYVAGEYSAKNEDDYQSFPGLVTLSKSYNSNRDSAGLGLGINKLSQVLNNVSISPVSNFLKKSLTDNTPQSSSYSFWVDEPTMTQKGIIHYKSSANIINSNGIHTLEYGTSNGNILAIDGAYDGVAYNMTDMSFAGVGFSVDGSGNTIVQDERVVNSWSATLPNVFQSANIINDINALASQFSGDFTVTIPGDTKQYAIAQPVSLVVMSGNTLSPVTGIYNIISVSQKISTTFTTTFKIQRLVMSSANEVASAQGILQKYSAGYSRTSYTKTDNIISTGKVDFGTIYPTFEHIGGLI